MAAKPKNSILFPLSIVLFYTLWLGCNGSPKNSVNEHVNSTTNNTMSAYSASVNSLKLPLNDTCDGTLTVQNLTLPDSLSQFKKYGQLIGKVNETEKYIAVLYAIPADIQLPILQTFSKDGKEISSLKLIIGNCCGEDEDCSGLSTFQITKSLQIILKDSVQTFERDKKKSDKKRNIKILKQEEVFKIDSTGVISREN